jgi:hypothetical protein
LCTKDGLLIEVRLVLQIPLAALFLFLLAVTIYSQNDGFKPLGGLMFGIPATIVGFILWMSFLLGSPKVRDEEWKKKHLSSNSPFFVWGRRILFCAALVKLAMILIE